MKILEWENILLVVVALIAVWALLEAPHRYGEFHRVADLRRDSIVTARASKKAKGGIWRRAHIVKVEHLSRAPKAPRP